MQSAVESLVDRVTTKFVRSKQFRTLWVRMNRVAHTQLDYVLTGRLPKNAVIRISDSGS